MCAHSRAHAKGIYIFMIEINNLVKKFGKKYALDGVSFSIKKGEIVGFLGPNGAGKSTTMNIITGYISPTSGSVTVGGVDVFSEPMKVKKMMMRGRKERKMKEKMTNGTLMDSNLFKLFSSPWE